MHYVHNTYVCIYTPHKYMYTNKHADLCKLQQVPAPPSFCPQSSACHAFHILQHQAPSTYLQTIAQLYYNTYTSITTTTTTATYPPDLIEPCILAGSPLGGQVIDPFGGAGTTGLVAKKHNRNAILIELNEQYADISKARLLVEA